MQSGTVGQIKETLRSGTQKRLHVKLNGILTADSLLSVSQEDGTLLECVYTEERRGYTVAGPENIKEIASSSAMAHNPYIVLSPSRNKMDSPKVKVSRGCFKRAKAVPMVKAVFPQKLAPSPDFFSLFFHYQSTHRIHALSNLSSCFVAMDAVLDENGVDLTLIPPNLATRASVLTTLHEIQIEEMHQAHARRLGLFAGVLAMGAAVLVKSRPPR